MHPIVIMAYDKSPAINKAVAALEEAGMEVRVLNTNHAKLADFLGALAGEDDIEDEDVATPPAEEEPADDEEASTVADEVPSDDLPPEEELATEALTCLVDGERVSVQLVEGNSELIPTGLMVGNKTAYALNETHYAFWPVQGNDGLFDLVHDVQVVFGDKAVFETVRISQPAEKAVLKLNCEVYSKFKPE